MTVPAYVLSAAGLNADGMEYAVFIRSSALSTSDRSFVRSWNTWTCGIIIRINDRHRCVRGRTSQSGTTCRHRRISHTSMNSLMMAGPVLKNRISAMIDGPSGLKSPLYPEFQPHLLQLPTPRIRWQRNTFRQTNGVSLTSCLLFCNCNYLIFGLELCPGREYSVWSDLVEVDFWKKPVAEDDGGCKMKSKTSGSLWFHPPPGASVWKRFPITSPITCRIDRPSKLVHQIKISVFLSELWLHLRICI